MRRYATVGGLIFILQSIAAMGQDADPEPEPELHQLKGAYECSVLQTAGGDILHLNCTETESPLAGDWDFEIYNVTRSRFSDSRITIWIRSRVDMDQLRLIVRFHYTDDGMALMEEDSAVEFDVVAGETWSDTVYSDFEPIQSVEISGNPLYGNWVCQGCGEFVFTDIEVSSLIDPRSIQLEDMGRFMQEVQEALYE